VLLDGSAEQAALFGLAQHRGVDEARGHGVDGDAHRAVLQRQRFGEAVHRGFGGHIGRHERLARLRTRRGDVDDPAPARVDHVRKHGLDTVKDAVEVDVDHAAEVRECQVGESLEALHPRRVHQDADRAELFSNGVQRSVDRGAVGHIGGVRELLVGCDEVEGGDVVSVGTQPIRDGLTDAGAATGDHGSLHATAPVSDVKNQPFGL
jgi:hypothetical protein